jgi:hypothetical protein
MATSLVTLSIAGSAHSAETSTEQDRAFCGRLRAQLKLDLESEGQQRGPTDRRGAIRERLQERALERFDADDDGVLDRRERAAARARTRAELRAAREKRLDTDRDGTVEPSETARLRALRTQAEQREQSFMRRFDRNGDGVLSDEESQRARERVRQRLDRNSDGQIDRAERARTCETVLDIEGEKKR